MRRALWSTGASLLAILIVASAGLAQQMDQCHRIAKTCLKAGGSEKECQEWIDDCMSRLACEEVYLSCLELMEIDETVTEATCDKKRASCRRKRGDSP